MKNKFINWLKKFFNKNKTIINKNKTIISIIFIGLMFIVLLDINFIGYKYNVFFSYFYL